MAVPFHISVGIITALAGGKLSKFYFKILNINFINNFVEFGFAELKVLERSSINDSSESCDTSTCFGINVG